MLCEVFQDLHYNHCTWSAFSWIVFCVCSHFDVLIAAVLFLPLLQSGSSTDNLSEVKTNIVGRTFCWQSRILACLILLRSDDFNWWYFIPFAAIIFDKRWQGTTILTIVVCGSMQVIMSQLSYVIYLTHYSNPMWSWRWPAVLQVKIKHQSTVGENNVHVACSPNCSCGYDLDHC